MYSLRRRLLISATLLLVVFLGVMGVALNQAFEESVISNAEDALRNQVLLLIANIDVVDGKVIVPATLPEPRLGQTDSSLYAQISIKDQGVVWRSPSLLDKQLPTISSNLGEFDFIRDINWSPNNPPLFATSLGIEWETERGDLPFTVVVAEHSDNYLKRLSRFQRQIGLWLSLMALALIALLLLLLGWALKPLGRVATQVGEIEEGRRQRFSEDYPLEVSRLTQNLNQLLNFEELRITRHKEVLGNLAHSLKTPIAILSGLKYSKKTDADAHNQLSAMQTIIDYQLQSASAVGRRRFAKPIKIVEITQQIINSMDKLHNTKGLKTEVQIDRETQFFGDQGDWMELAGNLIDNAYKWAKNTVRVTARNLPVAQVGSHRLAIELVVEDDGPGISDELENSILQRGVRLDSQTPGHGLGLHIVKGIVEAYEGEIEIGDAENYDTGGTKISILLK